MIEKINRQAQKLYDLSKRVLRYLRINDEKDMLSLTNIALILVLFKISTTDATSMKDIGALLTVIFSYQAKRFIEKKNGNA